MLPSVALKSVGLQGSFMRNIFVAESGSFFVRSEYIFRFLLEP